MMTRTLPQTDIYATCPTEGIVLDYYAGVFEAVYVCFNPFIRPAKISPQRFCPEKYPTNTELLNLCQPVTWRETMTLAGLPSLAAVDRGLKTQILGVRTEFRHEGHAKKLAALYDEALVMPPTEGEQSPFLYEPVFSIFKELGHEWAWIGDEFCTERKLHWIDDLVAADPTPICGHANVFSLDKSVLWSVHWDSHYTFLCGSRTDLEHAKVAERLEGFYCTPTTDVFWSVRGA
ncbi:DUF2711 family protein [Burkholderia cenocepacia]|uniref:DUF2711 family protein n=1 Tax=Burkholderia cenocepacia TaxID=95486 RepID=UPI002654775E|nr:DUF2711 family protein [Burkholderia cenocepacia]MDN7452317.1 DUF2711 family protein [Burkholderia cenocepacia]